MGEIERINEGDRVVIRPELADGFILPLRDFGTKGRIGTVEEIIHTTQARVCFDHKRGDRNNFCFWLKVWELALARPNFTPEQS